MQQRRLFVNLVGNRQIFCLKSLSLIHLARDCLEVEILFIHVYVNYKKGEVLLQKDLTDSLGIRIGDDDVLSYELFINFSHRFSASHLLLAEKC